MDKINKDKMTRRIKIIILLIAMIFPIMFSSTVHAGFGEGEGGNPSEGGAGYWWHAAGTNAWQKFVNIQLKVKYNNIGSLKSKVNSSGQGYKFEDGSRESLWDTCARSEYIWWYGATTQSKYDTKYWFTQANGTNRLPASSWQSMSSEAKGKLLKYKDWSSNWSGGKVVLICSAINETPNQKKIPLKLVAKSGKFTYDGKAKTVKGIDTGKSNLSKLKPGHKYSATVKRTETNVGAYPVKVKNPKVTDSHNKDVTNQYKISTKDGILIIVPQKVDNNIDPTDNWQCVDNQTDSATAYVFNTTKGYHGFTPSGAPNLNETYEDRWTTAGRYADLVSPPDPGSPLSLWDDWKSTFESGSDTETPELNLENSGVSSDLSKYGGVYNISRSLRQDTYNITHCQPQTRELETKIGHGTYKSCTTTPDGKTTCETKEYTYTYTEWTPWADDGERVVLTSNSVPLSNTTYNHYQILSVNCNRDGFNSVRNSIGGTVRSLASGDGGAVLETPERSGQGPGILGTGSHITATDSFYNDGNSCREAFVCTVEPKASARNDANNNQKNKHLFAEYKEDAEPGENYDFPNDNGEVIFFRDNNDRQVRADIWYPKPTGKSDLESYSGDSAQRTFTKIYNNPSPTPEIDLTSIAPWDSKNDIIKNINTEKVYSGNVNRFLMKSQWASDEGKPYQLGVNWEYTGTGTNIVPEVVDGYTVKSMTGEYIYYFDVYCNFKNNTGNYQANIPDTPFANGQTSRIWNLNNAVRALFTRSVSDTTK